MWNSDVLLNEAVSLAASHTAPPTSAAACHKLNQCHGPFLPLNLATTCSSHALTASPVTHTSCAPTITWFFPPNFIKSAADFLCCFTVFLQQVSAFNLHIKTWLSECTSEPLMTLNPYHFPLSSRDRCSFAPPLAFLTLRHPGLHQAGAKPSSFNNFYEVQSN